MKTKRTNSTNRKTILITLASLAAALLAGFPTNARAGKPDNSPGKPVIYRVADSIYEDTEGFCVPVRIHISGALFINRDTADGYAYFMPGFKIEFTNLEDGKTVTASSGGRNVVTYSGEFDQYLTYSGATVWQLPNGTLVTAGLTIILDQFDPETWDEVFVVVKSVGNHLESFDEDAICAALQ
ncbi:MAG: hypothetical protein KIS67_05065 [Verrucomicrobiae bacterium]|nr:hypothetical protein [Verrucomicrobiae bacterium]